MIKGMIQGDVFEIDEMQIKGSQAVKDMIEPLMEPVFGPADGDPDLALFNRLRKTLPAVKLIKYIPMIIDPDVVY